MKPILLYNHLGLGDHIICRGIVAAYRERWPDRDIKVLCKLTNSISVGDLLGPYRIKVVGVQDDGDAQGVINTGKHNHEVVICGGLGRGGLVSQIFDKEFYRQANVPFENRWKGFENIGSQYNQMGPLPNAKAFVHDDYERGFRITQLMDTHDHALLMRPMGGRSILQYITMIRSATEIHCIDSCFAILIDSIDLPTNPKLFLHRYARPGAEYPTYQKNWIIL